MLLSALQSGRQPAYPHLSTTISPSNRHSTGNKRLLELGWAGARLISGLSIPIFGDAQLVGEQIKPSTSHNAGLEVYICASRVGTNLKLQRDHRGFTELI